MSDKVDILVQAVPVASESRQEQVVEEVLQQLRDASKSNDVKLAGRAMKRFYVYRKLQGLIGLETRAEMIELLMEMLRADTNTVLDRVKLLKNVHSLLSEKRVGLEKYLKLDWKELWGMVNKYHIRPEEYEIELGGAQIMARHAGMMGQVCQAARFYYDETVIDEVWDASREYFQDELSRNVFLGQALLLMFLPNRPSPKYGNIIDEAVRKHWHLIDHCNDWDNAWLCIVKRALKYGGIVAVEKDSDLIPHLFRRIQDSLNLTPPSGFNIPTRTNRPSYISSFLGGKGGHGVSSGAKISIMLIGCGTSEEFFRLYEEDTMTSNSKEELKAMGDQWKELSAGMLSLKKLLGSIQTLFHPSNTGRHSSSVASFTDVLCGSFAKRLGRERVDSRRCLYSELTIQDKQCFVDGMFPLLEMAMYSKNRMVVHFAQNSIGTLAYIAPLRTSKHFMNLLGEALDPNNLLQTHQAPSAIKTLANFIQPLLQVKPILAPLLPEFLELTLAGLDPNDVTKTIATSMFYQIVLSWVPIVDVEGEGLDYPDNIEALVAAEDDSQSLSFLKSYGIDGESAEKGLDLGPLYDSMWRGSSTLVEWSLQCLEKLLGYINNQVQRAKGGFAGQLENALYSGMAILGRLLFAQMSPKVRHRAGERLCEWALESCNLDAMRESKSIVRSFALSFIASKDKEATEKMVMNGLFEPFLAKAMDMENTSERQIRWSLLILGAIARVAGPYLLPYEKDLVAVIDKALDHEEASVRKLGGKLLRRTMRGLNEYYIPSRTSTNLVRDDKDKEGMAKWALSWGKAVPWTETCGSVEWHEPSREELSMCRRLKEKYIELAFKKIEAGMSKTEEKGGHFKKYLEILFQVVRGAAATTKKQSERNEYLHQCCKILPWLVEHRPSDTTSHRRIVKVMTTLLTCYGSSSGSSKKLEGRKAWFTYMKELMGSPAFVSEMRASVTHDVVRNREDSIVPRFHQLDDIQTLLHLQAHYESFEAARYAKDVAKDEHIYEKCFEALLRANRHDWRDTRKAAVNGIKDIFTRLPWFGKTKVDMLIDGLRESPSYGEMCGSANLVAWGKIVNWISTEADLFDQFIRTILFDSSVKRLPEDKQQETSDSIQTLVVDVLQNWIILPRNDRNELIRRGLLNDLTGPKSASFTWRDELIVCATIMTLLRGPEDDDFITPGIVDWVIQRTCSDILPLRDSALKVVTRLLVHVSETRRTAIIKEIGGFDKSFFADLVDTIAQSHSSANVSVDGNARGLRQRTEYSAGVSELNKLCRFPGSRYLPRTCAPSHSREFKTSNKVLLQSLCSSLGMDTVTKFFPDQLKGLLHEDTETAEYHSRRCAAAEVFSGMISAHGCVDHAVDIVVESFYDTSLESAEVWLDSFRLAKPGDHSKYLEVFVKKLKSCNFDGADAKESVVVSNLLRMIRTLLAELDMDKNAKTLHDSREAVISIIIENLGHPYETVRREMGRSMAAFMDIYERVFPKESVWISGAIESLLEAGVDLPKEKEASKASRTLETLLHVTGSLVLIGGPAREKYVTQFFDIVLDAQGHPNIEAGKKAKSAASCLAAFPFNDRTLAFDAVKCLSAKMETDNWYARSTLVQLFGSYITMNGFVLGYGLAGIHVRKEIEKLLRDQQVEVQNMASSTLTSVLSSYAESDATLQVTLDRYLKLTNTKVKRDQYKTDQGKEKLKKRNTGVLGLAALVGAFPYTVPFPEAVVALARRGSDPMPVGPNAKQAILNFKRTHADSWAKTKLSFTTEELEDLQDSSYSSSHA